MSMYPIDKCHFCGKNTSEYHSQGSVGDPNDRLCRNSACDHRYTITNRDGIWVTTFRIKEYYFQMFHNLYESGIDKLEIVGPNDEIIAIPECRMITLDNYLEEVERARKLQIFK